MTKFKKFIRNDEAATAIEYGLIAALIAVAAIGAFQYVGNGVNAAFSNAGSKLENPGAAAEDGNEDE